MGAESTVTVLGSRFWGHGPPLVLKSDNGPGFIAADALAFADRWQVYPLFSPPYTLGYNDACEAGIGAMKTRTHQQASLAGRTGHGTADDIGSTVFNGMCMEDRL